MTENNAPPIETVTDPTQEALHTASPQPRSVYFEGLPASLLATALAIFLTALVTIFSELSANTRHAKAIEAADEVAKAQMSADAESDILTRRQAQDLHVSTLIEKIYTGTFPSDHAGAILCPYWSGLDLGPVAVAHLNNIVLDRKLCGSDGGGYHELVVRNSDNTPEEALLNAEKLKCIASPWVERNISVSDKSGIHSSPKASAALSITAQEGSFLSAYEIVFEDYRRPDGKTVSEQLKSGGVTLASFTPENGSAEIQLPVAYNARVACTNSSGTGRTCQARVILRAREFPASCAQFFPNGFDLPKAEVAPHP